MTGAPFSVREFLEGLETLSQHVNIGAPVAVREFLEGLETCYRRRTERGRK